MPYETAGFTVLFHYLPLLKFKDSIFSQNTTPPQLFYDGMLNETSLSEGSLRHFGKSPLEIAPVEPEEYLYDLMQKGKTTSSQSEFKHLVYGLRKRYLLYGLDSRARINDR